jgi:hypothetical protein
MAHPQTAGVQLRPELGSLYEFDLDMQRRNYVGLQIMPRLDVARQSGKFGRIPIDQLLSAGTEKLERAATSGFSRQEWSFVDESFSTQERGVEEPIDDRESALYADYFDAEVVSTSRALERLFAGYERRVIAKAVDATVTAGQATAAAAAWDVPANADARGDVLTAARAIWQRSGLWPNTLVIDRLMLQNLQDSMQVIDRITSAGFGSSGLAKNINAAKLAEFFDIDRVLVADAIKLGSGGAVSSLFPTDKALLLRAAVNNDLREPCFGRTLVYQGVAGRFEGGVETYRQEEIAATIVRIRHESDEKILYPELAQVITGLST